MPKMPHMVLAAGGSSRMGQPKALLPWGATSLIKSRISILLETKEPVLVVLGADATPIADEIASEPVHTVINNQWHSGMGSSIVCGMQALTQAFPDAQGVLISLVDQPLIPATHYQSMYEAFHGTSNAIVVSEAVSGWRGVPVLFGRSYFTDLLALDPSDSGKTLINRYADHLITIPGNTYLRDMDTPEAYAELKRDAFH